MAPATSMSSCPITAIVLGVLAASGYIAEGRSASSQTLRPRLRSHSAARAGHIRCLATPGAKRRQALVSEGLVASMALSGHLFAQTHTAKADVAADSGVQIGIPVGKYLPASPVPGRFRFTPGVDSTPSIRGRVLKPLSYTLDLPGDWKAITVGVIQTGDFCQPKCDEPWTEVKFEGENAGKVKIMMVPSFRLTNIEKPSLEELGSAEEVIQKVGPFVTGDYYDGEDMPTEIKVIKEGSNTYYEYVIESPGAVNGPHNVAVVTTIPGPTDRDRYHAIMAVASAKEKEWSSNADALLSVARSFRLT
mmetsp:Transcript_8010/g.11352  ORF Transcript_8010/g.11352 Transcript_8010/m.11352 type:complete len:305 (-) Transcript_8010:159-1073(-)